ncbi:bifunctional copper resistance protein CopD/cytochrome c oxidase assembly protein [Arthrobacter sp. TB 23]|uniref:bifunctional copper resistance protein CopD/cytochrome c oxidase assembly protein n=1 Tax=Arthrobacter sp. TB 23 TaxID=494419 RepID=UPI00030FABAF|nr:bifunctional copper resistance protein CopD/cytochrome c oxidase assembly protein [Arthrobacter sp. TB 23]
MNPDGRVRRILWAMVLVFLVPFTAVAVLAVSGTTGPPGPGLPDPGAITRWGAPVARALHDAAAALTIGFLVTASVILPHQTQDQAQAQDQNQGRPVLGSAAARAVLFAAGAASVWAVAGAAVVTFAYSDVAGSSPSNVNGADMVQFLTGFDLGRSLGLSAFLALIVATGCWMATRTLTVGLLTLLSLVALTPLTVTAHGASNHEAAVNLLGLHLIGVTVWTGGLAALVILRRTVGADFPVMARRYSRIAGASYVLVLVTGVAGAVLRLASTAGLEGTYGILLITKTVAVLLLGAAGWYQRRRILTVLASRPMAGKTFARFAGFEVFIMAFTFGLSVALGRTSPFAESAIQSAAESFLGAALPPEPGPLHWLTQWQFDVVWAPIAVLLLGWYVNTRRKAVKQGQHWPVFRTVTWALGCALLLWATSGAPAVYARLLPSMFVTSQLLIGLIVPALFSLSRPFLLAGQTLASRTDGSRGIREWLTCTAELSITRKLVHPVTATFLYLGFHGTLYFTPLLGPLVSSNAGRLISTGAALAIGYLFCHTVLSNPPSPKAIKVKAAALLTVLIFHLAAGVSLATRDHLIGGDWYLLVGELWNIPVTTDQPTAGLILWGAALPPLLALAIGRPTPAEHHLAGHDSAGLSPAGQELRGQARTLPEQ